MLVTGIVFIVVADMISVLFTDVDADVVAGLALMTLVLVPMISLLVPIISSVRSISCLDLNGKFVT